MADKNVKRKRINPYLSGRNNYFDNGGFKQYFSKGNWGNPFKGELGAEAVSGLMGGLGNAAGLIGGNLIGGGLLSGAGDVISGLSSIASAIPGPWGAAASAGLGLIGGLTNKMFGSKLNLENIANIESVNTAMNTLKVDDSSNSSVANAFGSVNMGSDFTKSDVGKDGWFSNKADKEYRRLLAERHGALNRAYATLGNAALNADANMDENIMTNFAAYGGPLFALGGSIHIKPENRGKFNATKRRTGKTTEELTHSSNPITRKRAIFALNAAKWKHAFGGELGTNGADFTNGLIFIDNGGSHESNPYEGVPMGVDQEGTPNLVEEGEVIFNDYVFSNRLRVPKAVRRKYKLREGGPLTFADAVKKLSKESEERPNDPISLNGLLAWASDLMMELENIRLRNMKGLSNRFDLGSFMKLTGVPKSFSLEAYNSMVDLYAQEHSITERGSIGDSELFDYATKNRLFDKWNPAKAKYNYDWYAKQAKMLGMTDNDLSDFKNSLTGVDADNLAAFNTLANTWRNNKRKQDWDNTLRQNLFNADLNSKVIRKASGNSDNYFKSLSYSDAGEGYRKKDWIYNPNDTSYGLISSENFANKSKEEQALYEPVSWGAGDIISDSKGIVYDINSPLTADLIKQDYTPTGYESDAEDQIDILFPGNKKYNPLTALRYAPALGAGISAFTDLMGWTNKPDYTPVNNIRDAASVLDNKEVSYTPLGDYMAYTPLDRNYYLNQLNALAGATRRGIINTSSGNSGAAMAGLLAADYNYLNSVGSLARLAEEYNLAQREKALAFNRDTNKFNSEMQLKADMANQAMRNSNSALAYKGELAAADLRQKIDAQSSAAKSANLTNLFNSLGNIGREEMMREMTKIPGMNYRIARDGLAVYTTANGGYLTIRKRRKR